MRGSWFEQYKPELAMVTVQCIYAAMALSTKAAFTQGMSPMVFVVYRQAAATMFLLPHNHCCQRAHCEAGGTWSERLLFGVCCCSYWSDHQSVLLLWSGHGGCDNGYCNHEHDPSNHICHGSHIWEVICKRDIDSLSVTVWMCFFATIQSAIVTLVSEPHFNSWKLTSTFEILCCLFSGTMGSGATFYLQSWSISKRGPLFTAMFNPLNSVIATVVAVPVLHEELHLGSVLGEIAVVVGLYVVLWGKAGDFDIKIQNSGDGFPKNNGIDITESFLAENQMVQ